MAGPFGSLYAPTEEVGSEAAQQTAQLRRSSTPLQTINLKLPTTISPRAPISKTLLQPAPHVGGVNPDKAVLASILRATMGQHATLPPSGLMAPGPIVRPPSGNGVPEPGGPPVVTKPTDPDRPSPTPIPLPTPSPLPRPGPDPGPTPRPGPTPPPKFDPRENPPPENTAPPPGPFGATPSAVTAAVLPRRRQGGFLDAGPY